jgi:predicted nucleotide-binding protein
MRLRVFVGSSREAMAVCRAVQAELVDDLDVTVWDQDVFRPSYGALDSLLEKLESSDVGGITTLHYDAGRFGRRDEQRAAVGPACRTIREAARSDQARMLPESAAQARLDGAMRR